MTAPALELRGVQKRFGATEIVQGVDLAIEKGERHALIGPNGAGKSVLFHLISARYPVSAGTVLLHGEPITGLKPHEINRRGLARSFQVTNLFHRMTVFENVRCAVLWSLGYRYSFWRRVESLDDANAHTAEIVERVGLTSRAEVPAGILSYAEQRALEIGIAIAGGADVILLDEPTAGMSRTETEAAVDLIRRVTEGRTLLIVEHDMSVVFGLADRISVLVYGRVVATGTPEEIRANAKVQEAYLGAAVHAEVRDLHAFYGKSHVLHGVDLAVREGEIVSLLGRNGVGRSTTVKAIMGQVKARGSVRFRGEEMVGLKPYQVARKGLGYVPEDRAMFADLTVRENLEMGRKPGRAFGGFTLAEAFALFPSLERRAGTPAGVLSGGEQQMLALCRTMMGNPGLAMIDEPTEGLAPMVVEQVAKFLETVRARGVPILLVEQKLAIALDISQRVYVLGHGKVVFEGTPEALRAAANVRKEWLEV